MATVDREALESSLCVVLRDLDVSPELWMPMCQWLSAAAGTAPPAEIVAKMDKDFPKLPPAAVPKLAAILPPKAK